MFTFPLIVYRRDWERLVKGDAWDLLDQTNHNSWIGVKKSDESGTAVRIGEVIPDSPAEKAGITSGDEILQFGDVAITQFDTLREQVQRHSPGDSVKVYIRRAGKKIVLDLQIGTRERETQR